MIQISIAIEEDLDRVLEIKREAISPTWTHGTLLNELYREDSFFAVARCKLQITNYKSQMGDEGADSECGIRNAESLAGCENICGFVILRRMGDDGELMQIAVDKAARRHGVADVLMESALFYASMNFLKSVFLDVRMSNVAAIELYKKHGFLPVRTRKDYYNDPIEDGIVMVREATKQHGKDIGI